MVSEGEGGGGGGTPGGAVEGAVAYGFAHVVGKNGFGGVEVGYGAGHFEDAVVGAGAHVEARHGVAQYCEAFGVEGAMGAEHARGHLSVAIHARLSGKATGLTLAGCDHAGPYGCARFAGRCRGYLVEAHGEYLHLQVYAVEQRTGYAVEVFPDGARCTDALAGGMVVVAAGARVHTGHEHESRRIIDCVFGTGYGDMEVFERLTHHFEHAAREFREFVEEKHAVMGQGDFARHGTGASAHEGYRRNGVMRRTEGSRRHEPRAAAQTACHGMNFGGFQRLGKCERRHN